MHQIVGLTGGSSKLKPTMRKATSQSGVLVVLKTIVDSNERQLLPKRYPVRRHAWPRTKWQETHFVTNYAENLFSCLGFWGTIMIPEGIWVVELKATNGPGVGEWSGTHDIQRDEQPKIEGLSYECGACGTHSLEPLLYCKTTTKNTTFPLL